LPHCCSPEGDVKPLDIKYQGLLLGVRGVGVPGLPTYREETVKLPPDTTLIFYTDGLVDRRARAEAPGTTTTPRSSALLHDAVKAVAHESVDRVAAAAEYAVPGKIDDDMAILVVRTAPEDLETWDRRFRAEPIRVSEARKIAFDMFIQCGMDDDQADLACLLVSEVCDERRAAHRDRAEPRATSSRSTARRSAGRSSKPGPE